MVYYLIKCIFGPDLYRIYRNNQTAGRPYIANNLESYSSTIIGMFHGFVTLCKWTSPVILAFAYYRGYLTYDYLYTFSKLIAIFGGVLIISYLTRAMGRNANADYKLFLREYLKLNNENSKMISERHLFLQKYDFELSNWKPDYIANMKHPLFKNKNLSMNSSIIDKLKHFTWDVLAYACVHTFGLRMMYPGVILQRLINPVIIEGRSKLLEKYPIKRSIIHTQDRKNSLDTVFLDRRNSVIAENGADLIICCDGNAAFYEIGIFALAVERDYSVLGWNYPGFGQSDGLPLPEDVTSSADAIMQYAFSLGFKPENIILFSWSIGGFPVSWLAKQYPDLKGVIMDACFDNIVHLAKQQLPKFAETFIDYAIATHLNLDVVDLLKHYSGPLRLIRRTRDEIISTISGVPSANRGNELLIGILKKRYPNIINDDATSVIKKWLSAYTEAERAKIYSVYVNQNEILFESIIKSYVQEYTLTYPLNLGEEMNDEMKRGLALYLANRYLYNVETTHCTPLPKAYIKQPWNELDLLNKNDDKNKFDESFY